MKLLLIYLLTISSLIAKAENILLQAPGTSPKQYQQALETHKGAISNVEFVHRKILKNEAQELRLYQLGDTAEQKTEETLKQLKLIEKEGPLTLTSLRYIRDLSEKVLSMKISSAERLELRYFYCKAGTLLNEGPLLYPCSTQFTSLQALTAKFPQIEKVFIEAFSFNPQEMAPLSPKTAYQWTLATNTGAPIHFFGTFEQLLNQHFIFEDYISGTCEEYSLNNMDFELTQQGLIFFSSNCLKRASNSNEKSWVEKNKPWIYTAGALVLGGLIYSMKDKKLVINSSLIQ